MWLRGALLVVVVPICAQHSTTRSNPFDTPADRMEGGRLFKGQCAACHGPNGEGGAAGPDLTAGAFRRGQSDEELFHLIMKGIPGTAMPAFAASGREVWQVVGYVRSLSVGKGAARATGDPGRGARVFARSGCRECHSIGGDGGAAGPDLTSIGGLRSLGELRSAVADPDRSVSREYWTLSARTASGERLSGIRLNEDTHSFQYRGPGGLRSVLKRDLAEYRIVRTSPMPSYNGKLSAADLDDLVAYLASLRDGAQP